MAVTHRFAANSTISTASQPRTTVGSSVSVGTRAGEADSAQASLDISTGEGVTVFATVVSETIAGAY